MKLIPGEYYQAWGKCVLLYTGVQDTRGFHCNVCGKERSKMHVFVEGAPDNPRCQYFYGSECIKQRAFVHVKELKL